MTRDDTLWKGILENVCEDFLRFLFKEADNLFNFRKGFQFLDKELEQLFPPEEGYSTKFVDKLVKVFTREGKEQWVLIHIEVQGYYEKDFAKRMFTYFYRILDKYGKPVTAIAIYSDTNKKFHPNTYQYEYLGTKNIFQFNTYKIIDQDEEALQRDENPFAVIVLTVLLSLKRKRLNDQDLFQMKFTLARHLLTRNIPKKKAGYLLIFLRQYVKFADKEYNIKFDNALHKLTGNQETMGIKEMVLERARKEGLEQGIEKGIEVGKTDVVKNLILKMGLPNEQVAEIAEVSVAFVEKVHTELKRD